MRSKYPYAVGIDGLLQTHTSSGKMGLELVLWYTVEKREFFDNLVD